MSYKLHTSHHLVISHFLCSPFVHVAKRVDDSHMYAAYPQYGHSTVWPGYGYQMDDGEEFAHGKQLNNYVCSVVCMYIRSSYSSKL